ncbi:MAG: serine/threonine protein kinase [Thermoguttaceae bacterium]
MGNPSAEQIAQRALDLGLLDDRQLREVWAALGTRNVPVSDLLQLLVRREFLTNYQVERVVNGERSGFFFGSYKVLYLVGAGSFARVFRAVHQKTGAVVALKVLRTRYSENPRHASQFMREGHVGCTLRHPNIVPIFEVVSEQRHHFLVMEFVEGWNLQTFVKVRKTIEPLQAVKLMTDMTEGLRYAFEHGVTHRDLKLNNVLVSSAGQAKLVDFGLAAMDEAVADDALADLRNTRTIDYAALERATGVRKDDTRSDIYFLGCIFYHMLTGLAPLSDSRDPLQRLSKQRFLEVIPLQSVAAGMPHWVTLVVNKAMSLDPSRRYQSPSAMLADLHLAARQLAGKDAAAASPDDSGIGREGLAGAGQQRSVMIVESNQKMQDIYREGFKRAGYRVLLTSDPARAVSRFRQDNTVADCVLFAAEEIGPAALEWFNRLGTDRKALSVRALLLLGENQRAWEKDAEVADHRKVLFMPLTMRQLRAALADLLGTKTAK